MIGVPSDVISMPSPNVEVSRSRTVIGRRAGTVSSSGPSIRFSTCRSASSGSHGSTRSSSRSRHSSSRTIAAAIATGLDVEAIRKIVSRRIGAPPSWRIVPIASTCVSPPRLTRATSPGIFPDSTCRASTSRILRSPASEKPLLPVPIMNLLAYSVRSCETRPGMSLMGFHERRTRAGGVRRGPVRSPEDRNRWTVHGIHHRRPSDTGLLPS